jgi:hypothetical protein
MFFQNNWAAKLPWAEVVVFYGNAHMVSVKCVLRWKGEISF